MRTAACLAFLILSLPVMAKDDIYRWTDADGVIHYGSKPPSKDAKPAELPQLQTYRAGTPPVGPAAAVVSPTPVPRPVAELAEIRITAPVEGETFRDPQGIVPVSVSSSDLPPSGGFVYYLDGAAQNKKSWAAPSYTFTEVERGEHTITVAIVAADGTELKRTAPVRIFQMPPTAPAPAPKKGG